MNWQLRLSRYQPRDVVFSILLLVLCSPAAQADFAADVRPLLEASCQHCHDQSTTSRLNLEHLNFDLGQQESRRDWESIYDRLSSGEMPPRSEPRPPQELLNTALASLQRHLTKASLTSQKERGRVPARRLTPAEFEHTLHDLLGIRIPLAKHLPPETSGASFDTVASGQGMSLVHIRSYLSAADIALNEAIQLGRTPSWRPVEMHYRTSKYTRIWIERPLRRGGQTVKITDDAWVTFDSRPHVAQSNNMGYRPPYSGQYRITAEAYAYQAKTPVTMLIYQGSDTQGGAKLIGSFDLLPGKSRTVEATSYFTPEHYFFPAPANHDSQRDGRNVLSMGARTYRGEGLAIKSLRIEGPLEHSWPPSRTQELLGNVGFVRSPELPDGNAYKIELSESPTAHVREIVSRLGRKAFRRPLHEEEVAGFVRLAAPLIADKKPFQQIVRVPLRAIFTAPQFLYHEAPAGKLPDYALASRLSYFLWKSLPDKQLFELAEQGQLSDTDVLSEQVERMLRDPKSERFVVDFLDQWLNLQAIDATTPDEKLYPEYDDVLRQAMLAETRLFIRELITGNLSVANLIDSDFTFLNRRLAAHYGLESKHFPTASAEKPSALVSVWPRLNFSLPGEQMRRVSLDEDSPRGGILTQASVLKVTANGTVTSPVKRGNFVLSRILGRPVRPPPPDIGSIEPDTRGTTTIRETLDAHRNVAACATCHRRIDPPGFALESFDPIGGFRTNYRSTGRGFQPANKLFGRRIWEYRLALPVDSSGVTEDGKAFEGVQQFKELLLQDVDQVARNIVSKLVVYSTGAEIQFADREVIERILQETKQDDYPLRTLIHKVVQSRLFRNK